MLAVYVLTAIGVGTAVGPGHGYVVELLAIGLAALVALPLRDVLQRAVNRLMYGERDEPWRAMRRLGTRLECGGRARTAPSRPSPRRSPTPSGCRRSSSR